MLFYAHKEYTPVVVLDLARLWSCELAINITVTCFEADGWCYFSVTDSVGSLECLTMLLRAGGQRQIHHGLPISNECVSSLCYLPIII